MDYIRIIELVIAAVGGGGLTTIVLLKYTKKTALAQSKKEENGAYQAFLDTIKQQQDLLNTSNETFERIFMQKDAMVNDLTELVKNYRIQLEDNSKRIDSLKDEIDLLKKDNQRLNIENTELKRKVKGLEDVVKKEFTNKDENE
jgi:chromosome segregation ATPase